MHLTFALIPIPLGIKITKLIFSRVDSGEHVRHTRVQKSEVNVSEDKANVYSNSANVSQVSSLSCGWVGST